MAITYPQRTVVFSAEDTATLDWYLTNVAQDQIFDATPVLKLMLRSIRQPGIVGGDVEALFKRISVPTGTVETQLGIRAEIPLSVGQSTNTTEFRRGDNLPTNIDEGLTRAESLYAYYTDYKTLYLQDQWENSGPGKVLDRAKEQGDQMYRSLANYLNGHFWGDATDVSASQKKLPGIQHLISTAPTSGTVWGITRSSPNTWWRNNYDTAASFAANGLDKLRSLRFACSQNGGMDAPQLIVSTSTNFGYGVKQLEGIHRVTDIMEDKGPDLSTPMIRHMGTPWIWDDGCPSTLLYMLNFRYLKAIFQGNAKDYVEHPASPNNALLAQQTRVATGLTWGGTRFDRQGVLTISAA